MNGVERRAEDNIGPSVEAKKFLGEVKTAVDSSLQPFFNYRIREARNIDPVLVPIIERLGDFVRGGKRLRPAFFMAGYQGFGGGNLKEAIYTSMAVELVHAAVLVHDDIIDNSNLRRGKPTLHRQFAQNHDSEEFAHSLALLAGDTLVAYAIDVLGNSRLMNSESGQAARRVFDKMCMEVGYGETMDMLASRNRNLSQTQVIRTMEYKSARYTVARPLKMGAILGGAMEKSANALYEYGRHLGIAFQLQDDILGVFGDEATLGKPVDSDIKEGKMTLLVLGTIQALEEIGRRDDLEIFLRYLGNSNLSAGDFSWIKNLMVETGSLAKAQKMVAERTRRSLRILPRAEGLAPKQKILLEGIAEYLMEREV